jgi:NOL1/NOP2/fmu family ribosome biogenesis protein
MISALDDFAASTLCEDLFDSRSLKERFVLFGDNLYLRPRICPGFSGLKTLRAGLQLGSFIKGRFEPAHAWAMALKPGQCRNVVDITHDEARSYLTGMTLNREGKKGWYLVCYRGLSLGWGKLSGGILKNHYPKGLRKNVL